MTTVLEAPQTEAAVTSTVAPLPPKSERLVALDVFRGATIAGMLLVNDPGTWSAIYPPLEHAEWSGWTPTDLVFPFFLFIVGVTTHLSLRKRQPHEIVPKILRRGGLIFLTGLLLNWFPFFWWGKIAGNVSPTFFDRVLYRIEHLRYLGVLQRTGIAYMIAALITLKASKRAQIVIVTSLLVGYWILLMLVPVPGTGMIGAFVFDQPQHTLEAWSDQLILGMNHIWSGSKWWDPEGLLSTLGAVATAMLGVFCGRWIADKQRSLLERIVGLFGVGSLAMLGGSLWSWVMPINKNLWTPSYVVFCAGFACVVLATCLWLVDVAHIRGWTQPFIVYGVNPLIAFAGSGLMARITDSFWKVNVGGKPVSVHQATYQLWFEPFFPEKMASLMWGLCFVALWYLILLVLYRRNIIVKL
jgi:predicted acyltransferase